TTPSTLQIALAINAPLIPGSLRPRATALHRTQRNGCLLTVRPPHDGHCSGSLLHSRRKGTYSPTVPPNAIAAFTPYLSLTRIASDRAPVINAIPVPSERKPDLGRKAASASLTLPRRMDIDALNKKSLRFRARSRNGKNAARCIGGRQGVLGPIRPRLPLLNFRLSLKKCAAGTTRPALHLPDF